MVPSGWRYDITRTTQVLQSNENQDKRVIAESGLFKRP